MFRVAFGWMRGMRIAVAASSLALLAGAAPASAQQPPADACPYGWSTEQTVAFSPHGPDSGVLNPVDPQGCTLLDVVWNAEPFRTHGDFVRVVAETARDYQRAGLLTWREVVRIIAVAVRTDVGGRRDDSIDNSCPNRVAVTFDDGPSFYRSQTLAVLRNRQVPATFFDIGMRVDANPHMARFEAKEASPGPQSHVLASEPHADQPRVGPAPDPRDRGGAGARRCSHAVQASAPALRSQQRRRRKRSPPSSVTAVNGLSGVILSLRLAADDDRRSDPGHHRERPPAGRGHPHARRPDRLSGRGGGDRGAAPDHRRGAATRLLLRRTRPREPASSPNGTSRRTGESRRSSTRSPTCR